MLNLSHTAPGICREPPVVREKCTFPDQLRNAEDAEPKTSLFALIAYKWPWLPMFFLENTKLSANACKLVGEWLQEVAKWK